MTTDRYIIIDPDDDIYEECFIKSPASEEHVVGVAKNISGSANINVRVYRLVLVGRAVTTTTFTHVGVES